MTFFVFGSSGQAGALPMGRVGMDYYHSLEWLFVRVAPIAFIGAVIGIKRCRSNH